LTEVFLLFVWIKEKLAQIKEILVRKKEVHVWIKEILPLTFPKLLLI